MLRDRGESNRELEIATWGYNNRLAKVVDITIFTTGLHVPTDPLTLDFLFTEIQEVHPSEDILGKDTIARNTDVAVMYGNRLAARLLEANGSLSNQELQYLPPLERGRFEGMSAIITAELMHQAQIHGYKLNLPLPNPKS